MFLGLLLMAQPNYKKTDSFPLSILVITTDSESEKGGALPSEGANLN